MFKQEHFFTFSPDPMMVISKEGEFKIVDPALCKLLHYSEQELQGNNLLKIIHPDDHGSTATFISKIYSGNLPQTTELENRYLTKCGLIKYLSWKTCFLDSDYLYCIASDITEIKNNTNASNDLTNKLLRIIDMVPHPIFLKDSNGKYTLVNDAQAKLYSKNKVDLLGRCDEEFIFFENELAEIKKSDEKVLQKIITVKLSDQVLTHQNGSSKILHTIKVPFINSNNEVNILGVSIDLSELKEAENELKRINFELDNFVYHASHDIKAPLCSLLGLLRLMEIEKDPLMKEICISEAKKSVSKLSDFIKDLIDYSRNNRTIVSAGKIEFGEIIQECFSNLKYMEGLSRMKKIIKIRQNIDFFSDELRIKTILMNCISNAIKYQDVLKDNSILSIRISQIENNLCLTISDNGIGIEEENKNRIFDMFYRATELSSGSGLGLYIVKQIVDKLKGTMMVKSRKTRGTTFTIILPDLRNEKKSGGWS